MNYKDKFQDKDKNITLYNMDCMELLKNTEDNFYDLAIVDPPYGIGEAGEKNHSRCNLGKAKKYKNFAGNDIEPPTKEYFEELKRVSKKRKEVLAKFDLSKPYSLTEACDLVKGISTTKFDASIDICVRLGVDPRKANQMVRGTVALPHGTGKDIKVLVLCTPDKEKEAIEAGAEYVGLDDYIDKIKSGWTDIDVIITMPSVMGKVGALGRVLGPRGLMPNPKTGTVTMEIGKAVTEVKAGKIDFKVDKYGIIHSSVGKVSFDGDKIRENAFELIQQLVKLKPSAAKGTYIKSIYLSSTMSPGIQIDAKSVTA